MTDRTPEEMLDRIVDDIRSDELDDDAVSKATQSAWQRIEEAVGVPDGGIHGCGDFQALIPDLIAGRLTEARRLLVEDHTRGCVACRRVLMEARGAEIATAAGRGEKPRRSMFRLAVAAAAVIGVLAVGVPLTGNLIANLGLEATVESVDGSLRMLAGGDVTEIAEGETIGPRHTLRTGKQASAVIRLADGTEFEVDERSEFSLEGGLRGTTIRLTRGNIIVRAAEQDRGKLYVATQECLVSVKGTVFAVDHGLKGSRVSVLEGEVEVRRPGSRHTLAPGDQYTTNDRLRAVAIREQIAWSRHAEQHAVLLNEISVLQRDMAKVIEPDTVRTSTRLLDLSPPDTIAFVAAPNLAEGIADARAVFEERLASSETLRAWWDDNIVANGYDQEINDVLDRIEPFAESAGDEVVVAVPGSVINQAGGPLVLFALDDPATFESMVIEGLAAEGETGVVLIDDPGDLTETTADVLMWITGDLFAASNDLGALQSLAGRIDGSDATTFAGTELHQRLNESYSSGISWLVGVDVGTVLDQAATSQTETDVEMLELLGVLDAGVLVVRRQRDGDQATFDAELGFEGDRKGVAAWLAAPAPMGSLEFISPDAGLVAAVVAKDPALMFDEILEIVAAAEPTALQEIANVQLQAGFDIRADLVATLGGEAAFAIDGPLLPTPAWKLILEVYDPGTLQSTIERMIADANRKLEAEGETPIEMTTTAIDGVTFFSLDHPKAQVPVVFAMNDGFMVIAPQQALIQRAFQNRDAGVTLADSALFQELLPANGFTDCSAIVYRNLEEIVATLPAEALGGVPPETLEQFGEPGVFCAYGLPDRIVVSGTGGDMMGFAPALGLSGLLSEMVPESDLAGEPVSSGP